MTSLRFGLAALLIAAPLLAAGCGPAPVAVAPTAAAPVKPPPAASSSASSASRLAAAPSAAPAAPPAPPPRLPPLAEPLPALTRGFATLTLPGVKRVVRAISGRGVNDIWFIDHEEVKGLAQTDGGEVLHYDGKRIKSFGHPCQASLTVDVFAAKDAVVMRGVLPWSRGVWPQFRATMSPQGVWDCDGGGYEHGLTLSAADHVWELSCVHEDCSLKAAGGGPVAMLPRAHASAAARGEDPPPVISALWMSGLDDGWMIREDEDGAQWLLRYNGIAWAPQAALPRGIAFLDLWADDAHHAWLTVRYGGGEDGPANGVLRFDGKTLSELPVPATMATRRVTGSRSTDVWFAGSGRTVYQWDGQSLHRGEAPFEVGDIWAASNGEIWVVGIDQETGAPPPGVVAHTPVLPLIPSAPAVKP